MSLLEHAEKELKLSNLHIDDPELYNSIIGAVESFASYGHSGGSVYPTIHLLTELLKFKIFTPLTGEDDEWIEYTKGKFQNRRIGSVFKEGKDGQAYDIDGTVFVYPDGFRATRGGLEVSLKIEFPYIPAVKPIEVKVNEDGDAI